jgi:hypothetical protein
MTDTESILPTDVLSKAVLSGKEYGWHRQDIIDAIKAAGPVGLAVLGGQVQFVLPEGTCELYWISYDSTDRNPDEPWDSFVNRSSKETLLALDHIMSRDLVQEGVNNFGFLKEKQSQGANIEDSLLFIAYFQTEKEAEPGGAANSAKRRPRS